MVIRFIMVILLRISPVRPQNIKQSLIIGGEYALINDYPHAALMLGNCGNRTDWICSSSILNQRILLTAAHCLKECRILANRRPYEGDRIAVFFGCTTMSDMKLARVVDYTASHRDYDEYNGFNDIGLVLLRKDIPLGRYLKRVVITKEFPQTKSVFFETYVSGWGVHEKEPDSPSDHLRQVYQKLRSPVDCARFGPQHDGMFCAGRMKTSGGHYPSLGDSGSALVTRRRFHQIGITSFGWFLYPSMTVYTNTTYYYSWIQRNAERLYCTWKRNLYKEGLEVRVEIADALDITIETY